MRSFNKNLSFFFIVLLVLNIYFYSITEFSTEAAGFSSYIAFSEFHTLNTGHLVERSDIEVYNQFSSQLNTASQVHPILVLRSIISSVTGIQYTSWLYQIVFSALICVLFLLACMSLLNLKKDRVKITDYLICGFFFLMPTSIALSSMTYGGASLAYFVITMLIYLYFKEETSSGVVVKILLSSILAISYFTGAMALLAIFFIIILFEVLEKTTNKKSFNFTFLYLVILICYIMYISTSRFGDLVYMGKAISSLLFQDKVEINTMNSRLSIVKPFLASTSVENKIRIAINLFFVMIPPLYFVVCGHKYFTLKKERIVTFSLIFSLLPITMLTAYSIGSVGRLVEYGTLFSTILLTLMAGNIKEKHWKWLQVVALLAIFSSGFSYLLDENISLLHITYPEKYSSNFLSSHTNNDDVIFTDFRLASPVLAKGHFNTTGVQMIDINNLESEISNVNSIFWDNSVPVHNVVKEMKLGDTRISYLFFSNEMTKEIPGIRTYNFNLKPAAKDFILKYNTSPFFNRIFDSGACFVYTVN